MNKYFSLLALFIFAGCASQKINIAKLKPDDRIYTGKIEIQLNQQDNQHVVCDVFLNIDLNPVFRIQPDGFYYFKTSRKSLEYGKLACLQRVDGEQRWIYHDIDVKKIKRAEDENTITSLGKMVITWKFDDEDLKKPATRFADDTQDRIKNIGKFNIEFKPDLEETTQYIQSKFNELKDTSKFNFTEKLFEKDE